MPIALPTPKWVGDATLVPGPVRLVQGIFQAKPRSMFGIISSKDFSVDYTINTDGPNSSEVEAYAPDISHELCKKSDR